MTPGAFEVNFDGLVGPTHNYAGLSCGNLASLRHRQTLSHPKQAALQGLAKMKYLADLGLPQAVLPPQERPDLATLRRLGFSGSDADVLAQAHREDPILLAACYSASSMWAANAATVSPSPDAADARLHFTPANLVSHFHRTLEPAATAAMLRDIFPDPALFAHHPPLPAGLHFADEGAANHTRLCAAYGQPGIELFVFGRHAFDSSDPAPGKYPARQTLQASRAVARLHRLDPERTLFIQQNPAAIDAGAFHNDVVAVGNLNVLLYHAAAFADPQSTLPAIQQAFARHCGGPLFLIEVPEQQVPLPDAIASYLFNSQLITLPHGAMALICPIECREVATTQRFLDELLHRNTPIRSVHYVDVRQSMNNGGGPACLRLRITLTQEQLHNIRPSVFLTDALYADLIAWVERHYRDDLRPSDLPDPHLLAESRTALGDLTRILNLDPLVPPGSLSLPGRGPE